MITSKIMKNYNLSLIRSFDENGKKNKRYSIIIPVYNNYLSLPTLLNQLESLNNTLKKNLEVVFVVDGSPDDSNQFLCKNLPQKIFKSKLILLSRNFGAFAAIEAGIFNASGEFFAVMAADLQDPIDVTIKFFSTLETNQFDIVIGVRSSRGDPFLSRFFANLYWKLYKKYIQKDLPLGGVDFYGFNSQFKDQLITLKESSNSFIGLLFWLGFRRKFIKYNRLKRPFGKSSWSISMKIRYLFDSVYAFSDLPIQIIQIVGLLGITFSLISGTFVMASKIFGLIAVPGYTAIVLLIMFFGSLNIFALSVISGYIYRSYENTKNRPSYVIQKFSEY